MKKELKTDDLVIQPPNILMRVHRTNETVKLAYAADKGFTLGPDYLLFHCYNMGLWLRGDLRPGQSLSLEFFDVEGLTYRSHYVIAIAEPVDIQAHDTHAAIRITAYSIPGTFVTIVRGNDEEA